MLLKQPPANIKDDPNIVLPFLENIFKALSNGLNFSENFTGNIRSFTTHSTADTLFSVSHTLGLVPSYFLVISIEKAAIIYRDAQVTKPWTSTQIFLKCNVASTPATILIF